MIQKIEQLLREVTNEIENEKAMKILKGEAFNIFSILGIETAENNTHSSFIGELLNPLGSHNLGPIFLELFLQVNFGDKKKLHTKSARMTLEKGIGKVNLKTKTGGRIDIYLEDKNGNSLSIENKINAGEQDSQIERYFNFNKGKNTVLFLTKFGDESISAGELNPHEDYFPISYSETIIDWLDECQKQATDHPVLRESIKQYLILVKKLTYTMSKEHDIKLQELILSNLESAQTIASKINSFKLEALEKLQLGVLKALENELGEDYNVIKGNNVKVKTSSIWIKPKNVKNPRVYFGIEGFSSAGHKGNRLFYGIANGGPISKEQSWTRFLNFWAEVSAIIELNINEQKLDLDLSNGKILLKLIMENDESEEIYLAIAKQFSSFIKIYAESVHSLNKNKN